MTIIESLHIHVVRKSYSDPCLDAIKVPIREILLPISGEATPAHLQLSKDGTVCSVPEETERVPNENAHTQTQLSAKKLRGYGLRAYGGRQLTSSQFARFLVGPRARRLDEGDSDFEDEDFQSVEGQFSERLPDVRQGPPTILKQPAQHGDRRLLELIRARKRGYCLLEDHEETLAEDAERLEELSSASRFLEQIIRGAVEQDEELATGQSALPQTNQSRDGLEGVRREDTNLERRSQSVGEDPIEMKAKTETQQPKARRNQTQRRSKRKKQSKPTTISKTVTSLSSTPRVISTANTEEATINDMCTDEVDANQVEYSEYILERTAQTVSYWTTMRLRSLQDMPGAGCHAEVANVHSEQKDREVLEQVVRGVCDHCGQELMHLDYTDLVRFKLQHLDDAFVFNPEFQQQVEEMIFGDQRVASILKDIKFTGVLNDAPTEEFDDHPEGVLDKAAAMSDLDKISKLLRNSDSDSEDSSDSDQQSTTHLSAAKRNKKKKKGKTNKSDRSSKAISVPVLAAPPPPVVETRGSIAHSPKLVSPSVKIDEPDLRYRGNTMSWALSSYACTKFGWTLPRPVPIKHSPRLSEKMLEGAAPPVVPLDGPLWPLCANWSIRDGKDPLLDMAKSDFGKTGFFPYSNGTTALVTTEYSPGQHIVVALRKESSLQDGRPSRCPVLAVFDTTSWGVVLNEETQWTPRLLLSPSDIQVFRQNTVVPFAEAAWADFVEGVTATTADTQLRLNDELKVHVKGKRDIYINELNRAAAVELNCGFRSRHAAYHEGTGHQLKKYLAHIEHHSTAFGRAVEGLNLILEQAEILFESYAEQFRAYLTEATKPNPQSPKSPRSPRGKRTAERRAQHLVTVK